MECEFISRQIRGASISNNLLIKFKKTYKKIACVRVTKNISGFLFECDV